MNIGPCFHGTNTRPGVKFHLQQPVRASGNANTEQTDYDNHAYSRLPAAGYRIQFISRQLIHCGNHRSSPACSLKRDHFRQRCSGNTGGSVWPTCHTRHHTSNRAAAISKPATGGGLNRPVPPFGTGRNRPLADSKQATAKDLSEGCSCFAEFQEHLSFPFDEQLKA